MPDVFAGFLILGLVILIGFWDSLKFRDRVILSVHNIIFDTNSHVTSAFADFDRVYFRNNILICLAKSQIPQAALKQLSRVLFTLSLAGIFGELAFSYAVRHTIGVDPIRPPFLMARMIADGPGYRFLQENCAEKPYTVCKYIDRLPVSDGDFLWSESPTNGVFRVADLPTRIALSSEQTSFAIDVFLFDPVAVIASATRDFFRQFFKITLDLFLSE